MRSTSAENTEVAVTAPTHPDYDDASPDWIVMQDTTGGERPIKDKGVTYLPKTSGQEADGTDGDKRYEIYLHRAVYLNFPKATVQDAMGLMHSRDPDIEIPATMDYLRTSATLKGEGLASLLQNINKQQLIPGRLLLVADVIEDTDKVHYVLITAKAALNWHSATVNGEYDLDYLLIDESDYVFDEATKVYNWEESYRVMALVQGVYYTFTTTVEGLGNLNFNDLTTLPEDAVAPTVRGKTLNVLPATFINVTQTGDDVEEPPLLDQANVTLAYFRGDADYRLSLFKQGQGTFSGTGLTEEEMESEKRLGADGAVYSTNNLAEFKFVELTGQSLPNMKQALDDLKGEAIQRGVSLFDKAGVESGSALELRSIVKTSMIKSLALTGAEGLEKMLAITAEWSSVNETESAKISVDPNIAFMDITATPQDVMVLNATLMAGGMTKEDYHAYLYRNRYTDKPYEEWLKGIDEQVEVI